MGVSDQDRKDLPGLDEDEKLAELISVALEGAGKPLRWWTFGRKPGASHSVFMLEDVASDKRLDVGSVISSTVPFKIVHKGLTVDFEKSRNAGLLVSREQVVTTLLSF